MLNIKLLLTYKASKRTGSILPAKIVGATAQYLKTNLSRKWL